MSSRTRVLSVSKTVHTKLEDSTQTREAQTMDSHPQLTASCSECLCNRWHWILCRCTSLQLGHRMTTGGTFNGKQIASVYNLTVLQLVICFSDEFLKSAINSLPKRSVEPCPSVDQVDTSRSIRESQLMIPLQSNLYCDGQQYD